MRRFIYWLIRFILLAALVAMIWAVWYITQKGFTRKWRQFITTELHKRGVDITFSRLTYDPFNGLVAHDMVIVDSNDRSKTLAVINRIALDIDFNNFLQGKPFLNALDLRDARLKLPLNSSDPMSPRIALSHLNAHLLLPHDQFCLTRAEATIYGFHVTASGRFINPGAYHPASVAPAGKGGGETPNSQRLQDLLSQLNALKFEGETPRIEVQFGGDLAEPEKIFAQATVWAEKIRYDRYLLASVYAVLDYRDQLCTLKQLVASDAHGRLDAGGTLRAATGEADLSLKSTLDLQGVLSIAKVHGPIGECQFYGLPLVELSAHGNIREPAKLQASGRVALQKFTCRSVQFESMGAYFSWNGGKWYVDDFKLAQRTGEVTASAMLVPASFRCRLQSTINPRELLPLFSGKAADALEDLDFDQSPRFSLVIHGASADFDTCEADGDMKLGRTRIRGVPLNSATSTLRIRDGAVTYEQFKVDRPEGIATGSFTYDFRRHEVRLDRVRTSIITTDAAAWIDEDLVRNVAPYKFKTPPNLVLNGVVHLGGGSNTNLEVLVDAAGGMDYEFLKKNLSARKVTGQLLFTGDRLRISDVVADIFSGRLSGSADISLKKESPGNTAKIRVDNINFPSLTRLYFNYGTAQGVLSGEYEFSGRGEDARTMQGSGNLNVANGDVFAIPIFGPFSGILNGIVPGMGYNVARQAAASFKVNNGVVETNDFKVKGQGFEMVGGGKIFFLDDKINFNIRINAQGLPGVLFFPVSKLFEYSAEGPLSKPSWRPAIGGKAN